MRSFGVDDYVRACADDDTFGAICGAFEEAARAAARGRGRRPDPAGGLPALVLARRPGLVIDGAVVLNGVPVLAKLARGRGEAACAGTPDGEPPCRVRAALAERAREEFLASLA